MMNIDDRINSLIGKKYNSINYHCYHLIEELLDVPKLEVTVKNRSKDIPNSLGKFIELENRYKYCIALIGEEHIGIYLDNDLILHNDVLGVRIEHIDQLKYKYNFIKYYEYKK